MNKKVIWIVVAVVVVLAIAGAVVLIRKDAGQIKSDGTSKGKQVPVVQKQASFKELLALSSPQKCTFGDPATTDNSFGTVYISNNKMRGDFQAAADGRTIKSHMISDGQYSYVWMDNTPTGFRMSLNAPKTEGQPNYSGVDENKQINYNCQAWLEDAGLLTVPTTVTFQDFSAIPAAAKPIGSDPAACAACDSITDAQSKLQCRSALQCK